MAEVKTYAGSCHCGNVRFEVTTKLESLMACNCSICSRAGYLLAFVSPDQFKLLSGAGKQTDYQFNKKNIHHLFCSTCGIHSFGQGKGPGGKEMYAVNVRCLEDVDIAGLPVTNYDGKSVN